MFNIIETCAPVKFIVLPCGVTFHNCNISDGK